MGSMRGLLRGPPRRRNHRGAGGLEEKAGGRVNGRVGEVGDTGSRPALVG